MVDFVSELLTVVVDGGKGDTLGPPDDSVGGSKDVGETKFGGGEDR